SQIVVHRSGCTAIGRGQADHAARNVVAPSLAAADFGCRSCMFLDYRGARHNVGRRIPPTTECVLPVYFVDVVSSPQSDSQRWRRHADADVSIFPDLGADGALLVDQLLARPALALDSSGFREGRCWNGNESLCRLRLGAAADSVRDDLDVALIGTAQAQR